MSVGVAAALLGALGRMQARAQFQSPGAVLRAALESAAIASKLRGLAASRASPAAARQCAERLIALCAQAEGQDADWRRRRVRTFINKLQRLAGSIGSRIYLRSALDEPRTGVHDAVERIWGERAGRRGPGPRLTARLEAAGFLREGVRGVVAPVRACKAVETWRRRRGAGASAQAPAGIMGHSTADDRLPAAVASRADHYLLLPELRYMHPDETAVVAFGARVWSPLNRALGRLGREGAVVRPAVAMELLGRSMAAPVARLILEHAWREGWLRRPGYGEPLRYASACSGIDMFAEALDAACEGASAMARRPTWVYMHAAERRPEARAVLKAAWGLAEEDIFWDAAGADAAGAPRADLFMYSPDCGGFSRQNRGRGDDSVVAAARDAAEGAAFIRAGRALMVVIENVDERVGTEALAAVVSGLVGYTWYWVSLCAREHGGLVQARSRIFIVGVLKRCS